MNALRHDPWTLMNGIGRDIDRILLMPRDSHEPRAWAPAVDIRELDDRFEFVADVPGIAPEALEITLHDGVLSIAGERPAAAEHQGEQRRAERGVGQFRRQFRLPETVAEEGLEAECRHGVLTVSIPKKAKPVPHKIEVRAN